MPVSSRSRPLPEALAKAVAAANAGFGVYIHWPFCEAKCPYCDFNSHVRPEIDEARWTSALIRELSHYAEMTVGSIVTSISSSCAPYKRTSFVPGRSRSRSCRISA